MKKPAPSVLPAPRSIDLAAVRGGTGGADAEAEATAIMKTKHDTVKNSISNVR